MALTGTPAASERSRTAQLLMVLLLFPTLPDTDVPKTIVPAAAEVLAPSTIEFLTVLNVASALK